MCNVAMCNVALFLCPRLPVSSPMKLITAIIRPEKLEDVRRALAETDVYLMTVSETSGFGRQRGVVEVYRGQELEERMIPKLKVEIAVNDNFVDATVEAIIRGARSAGAGDVGDGKIFVTPLDDVIRIRTGETGPAAIGP
jgi:nitrogen regulatory protein P-II 2